jgi:hypothetical protein
MLLDLIQHLNKAEVFRLTFTLPYALKIIDDPFFTVPGPSIMFETCVTTSKVMNWSANSNALTTCSIWWVCFLRAQMFHLILFHENKFQRHSILKSRRGNRIAVVSSGHLLQATLPVKVQMLVTMTKAIISFDPLAQEIPSLFSPTPFCWTLRCWLHAHSDTFGFPLGVWDKICMHHLNVRNVCFEKLKFERVKDSCEGNVQFRLR